MFCPECGAANPDNAKFCGNCGHELIASTQDEVSEDSNIKIASNAETITESVSPQLKYGILVATVLIPLVGLIMGIIYLLQSDNEDKKSSGRLWFYSAIAIMILYLILSGGI